MSISAVGSGGAYSYPLQTPASRPAAQAPTPAPVAVGTDSDGDHDGSTGPKGNTVDVKA